LWGVHYEGTTLRLRPTGWQQLGAVAQMAVAGAFFLLLSRLGAERQLLVGVAAAFVVGLWGLLQWAAAVVARPDRLTMWWLRRRSIPWKEIQAIAVVERAPWWAAGWPPFEVVAVTRRSGGTVTLWPTRSGVSTETTPSPAAVQCRLLERYHATVAPAG